MSEDIGHLDALDKMKGLSSYYNWLLSVVRSHVGMHVMDAGCGVGNFSVELQSEHRQIVLLDNSEACLRVAAERMVGCKGVRMVVADLEHDEIGSLIADTVDTIVCLDVLEHLENDVDVLRRLARAASPGAKLILKVPALPWLYCGIDRASGHMRRYSRSNLLRTVDAGGWKVISIRYMNLCGVGAYWYKGFVLRRTTNFSRTFSAVQLRMINAVMPIVRLLDRVTGPPIGLSLTVIAERPV